jgi:uncharacterized membrane protein YdjX (TVP38/TMEM64 family)
MYMADHQQDTKPFFLDLKVDHQRWPTIRLIVLAVVIISFYLMIDSAGLLQSFNTQAIREMVAHSGLLGVLLYFCFFSIGQLLHIPGMIFVVAAALAFGNGLGLFYAMVGIAIGISVVFFVVRFVGGTPLSNPSSQWVRRAVARLDTQPFKTILLMRLVFSTGPWLNYVLAMSTVSYSHYISASVLGIIPQVVVTIFLVDLTGLTI